MAGRHWRAAPRTRRRRPVSEALAAGTGGPNLRPGGRRGRACAPMRRRSPTRSQEPYPEARRAGGGGGGGGDRACAPRRRRSPTRCASSLRMSAATWRCSGADDSAAPGLHSQRHMLRSSASACLRGATRRAGMQGPSGMHSMPGPVLSSPKRSGCASGASCPHGRLAGKGPSLAALDGQGLCSGSTFAGSPLRVQAGTRAPAAGPGCMGELVHVGTRVLCMVQRAPLWARVGSC